MALNPNAYRLSVGIEVLLEEFASPNLPRKNYRSASPQPKRTLQRKPPHTLVQKLIKHHSSNVNKSRPRSDAKRPPTGKSWITSVSRIDSGS
jgi:hypothetical protein